MKLLFLTDSLVPSNRASALHLRHLLPHLAGYFQSVVLLSQKGDVEWRDFSLSNHIAVRIPKMKLGLLWLSLTFRSHLKKIEPEVIYSRFVLVPFIVRHQPYAIELHDDAWNKGLFHKLAMKRAIKSPLCLGFTCITNAIKADLLNVFPSVTKEIEVIPDAASSPNHQYVSEIRDSETLKIAYVGSFHEGKGLEQILMLAGALPQHRFVIIGGTESQLAEKRKHCADNVDFLGFIDQGELWEQMRDIDICLLPNQPKVKTGKKSDIGRYTSPLKMFEYMAYAKPIIASDLEVLREVLDDSVACLVPPSDLQAWAEAVKKLESFSERKRLSNNALQMFNDRFTWDHRAVHIFEFINRNYRKV